MRSDIYLFFVKVKKIIVEALVKIILSLPFFKSNLWVGFLTFFSDKYKYLKNKLPTYIDNFPSNLEKLEFMFFSYVSFIYSIIYYYLTNIYNLLLIFFISLLEDKGKAIEYWSGCFFLFSSFLFYYLVIIELSTWLFGYSLLCYWFLFIQLILFVLIAWRYEVAMIWDYLRSKGISFTTFWKEYCDEEYPFTLANSLTGYSNFFFFKLWIYHAASLELPEHRYDTILLFTICIVYTFFFVSDKFDPIWVWFVAQYFRAQSTFEDDRSEPRFGELFYAFAWLRNDIMWVLKWIYKDDPSVMAVLNSVPGFSWHSYSMAYLIHWQRFTLWHHTNYSDIYYLRVLREYPFSSESYFNQTAIWTIDDFVPNWHLYFAWFLWGQFDYDNHNFWVKNFKEDWNLWTYLTNSKKIINNKIEKHDQDNFNSPLYQYSLKSSYQSAILTYNYFNSNSSYFTGKKMISYGAQREDMKNLTVPNSIKSDWLSDAEILHASLNTARYYWTKKSEMALKVVRKGHEEPSWRTLYKYNFHSWLDEAQAPFKIFKHRGFNLNDFFDISEVDKLSDFESPTLHNYSQLLNLKKSSLMMPNQIKYWFNPGPVSKDKSSLIWWMQTFDRKLTALEYINGIWPSMRWARYQYKKADWSYLITLVKRWLLRADIYINDSALANFILSLDLTPYEYSTIFKSFVISPYWWLNNPKMNFILDVLWIKYWYYFKPTYDIIEDLTFLNTYASILANSDGFWWFDKRDFLFEKKEKWRFLRPWIVIPEYMQMVKYFSTKDLYRTPAVPISFTAIFTPWESFSAFSKIWLNAEAFRYKNSLKEYWDVLSRKWYADDFGNPIFEEEGEGEDIYMQPLILAYERLYFNFYRCVSYMLEFFVHKNDFFVNKPRISTLSVVFHLSTSLHTYIAIFLSIYLYILFVGGSFYYVNFTFLHDVQFEQKELWGSWDYYWHSMTDIWIHYKTPEQVALLSFQTSLLMHYTFYNLTNYSIISNNNCIPFIQYVASLINDTKDIVTFFHVYGNYTEFGRNLLSLEGFNFFWSFFYLQYRKYTALLFRGGSDCNLDSLVWSYYDYLSQISIFLSWSLNLYFSNYFWFEYKKFFTLMKQATILFSSNSLTNNFFFLASPLLDSGFSRKIIHELFSMLNQYWFFDRNKFINDFLFNDINDSFIIKQGLLIELWYTFFLYFFWSGLDMYWLLEYKNFINLSKTSIGNFWDSTKYWIFAFLRSFWFIPKTWFPSNFHKIHESSWLKLRWMAYANSWIGNSIHIRPFYNLIQHIWWTSSNMNRAFSLTDFSTNLNVSGVNSYDNVWNFFEKWYVWSFSFKWETVLGVVRSFHINMKNLYNTRNWYDPNIHKDGKEHDYDQYQYDWDTDYLMDNYLNFDDETIKNIRWGWKQLKQDHEDQWNFFTNYSSTYNIIFNDFRTIERGHDKVNPPLNVVELGITPLQLLQLFWHLPNSYKLIYLTFIDQINYIDENDKNLNLSINQYNEKEEKKNTTLPLKEILDDEYLDELAKNLGWVEGWDDSFFSLRKVDWFLKIEYPTNSIFGFDLTFFFNHFLTWDYFSSSNFSFERSNIKITKEESQLYKLYNKIYSEIDTNVFYTDINKSTWRETPFGTIHSYEAIVMQWYKFTKIFDELSLTNSREDPFISLNKEHYNTHLGSSHISVMEDIPNSVEAYSEDYFAKRHRWFPYTNLLTWNVISPFLLGWVGDLYNTTIDSTTMLFSLLYATESYEPNIWINERPFFGLWNNINYKPYQIGDTDLSKVDYWSFSTGLHFPKFPRLYTSYIYGEYGDSDNNTSYSPKKILSKFVSLSEVWRKIYIKAFSWFNLMLYPTSFWYFFGIKSSAWLDYWSWQCGLAFDYCLGHFNYWPYLQPRHSFGTRLAIYDSYYGYYWSYWQREDDPSIVDVSTGIMESELNEKEEDEYEDFNVPFVNYTYDYLDEDDIATLQELSFLYWWLYYSFHHPYFTGATLFWFLVCVSFSKYLGLANYSFRWFLIKSITELNSFGLNEYFDFWLLLIYERTAMENKYWKNMFRYWNYWMNPVELTNNFDIGWDDLTSYKNDWSEQLSISYERLYILLNMISYSYDITLTSLFKFLDFKWIHLQLFNINWLVLDSPFPLNPFIVYTNIFQSWKGIINYEKFYHDYFLSHSHYNTLREPLNLNLFFDWSTGTYFDQVNLKSYYSSYRTTTELGITNFYAPSALGMFNTINEANYDYSLKGALELYNEYSMYDVYFHEPDDIIISHQAMFHNLSILKFLTFYSIDVFFDLLGSFPKISFDKIFFDFYLSPTKDYWMIFRKQKLLPYSNVEKSLEKNVDSDLIVSNDFLYSDTLKRVKWSPDTKHMLFLFWLYWYLPYDMLLLWLDTGMLFFDWNDWVKLQRFIKFWITSKFYQLEKFYTWLGFNLFFSIFIKNK